MFIQTFDTSPSLNEERGINPDPGAILSPSLRETELKQNIHLKSTWHEALGFEDLMALALMLSILNLGMHSTLQKQIMTNGREEIVHTLESLSFQFHRNIE